MWNFRPDRGHSMAGPMGKLYLPQQVCCRVTGSACIGGAATRSQDLWGVRSLVTVPGPALSFVGLSLCLRPSTQPSSGVCAELALCCGGGKPVTRSLPPSALFHSKPPVPHPTPWSIKETFTQGSPSRKTTPHLCGDPLTPDPCCDGPWEME